MTSLRYAYDFRYIVLWPKDAHMKVRFKIDVQLLEFSYPALLSSDSVGGGGRNLFTKHTKTPGQPMSLLAILYFFKGSNIHIAP